MTDDLAAMKPTFPHDPRRDEVVVIEAIALWCEALQGRQPLLAALGRVAEGLGACAGCLTHQAKGSMAPARAFPFNGTRPDRAGSEPVRSYAARVLGRHADHPRSASVWLSSLPEEHGDPVLSAFQQRAGISETAIITLAVEGRWVDYLELHFGRPVDGGTRALLDRVAETLSRTWLHRSPGLLSEDLRPRGPVMRTKVLAEPILSASNPARLSRAEFRVCLLLSRGRNATAVCAELGIGAATLKTHLRNIFAKTKTTCMAELVFQLLPPPAGQIQRDMHA